MQLNSSSTALEHQCGLFASQLPKRPYATDMLGSRLLITSRRRAMRRAYIQANPPWLRVFPVFDIDRPGAALAWEDADLPAPLWTAVNVENGHAHSGWALEAPVLLGDHDRQKPMRYLCAVESMMRECLGADPSYGGLITKNPLNQRWRTLWGPPHGYSLGELAEYLPEIERHMPKRRPELVGLGRNVDTFDFLRKHAYREVRLWYAKREQGIYIAWLTHLYHTALDFTANEHPTPLDHREVHHIAKSVARWVWCRFSAAGFAAKQAARGRRGGQVSGAARRGRTAERDAAIRADREAGMTQATIAAQYGISRGRVAQIVLAKPYQIEALPSSSLPVFAEKIPRSVN